MLRQRRSTCGSILLLLLTAGPAQSSTPTILPCHAERVLALLDPYRGERDIVPGWRCTGVSISDVVTFIVSHGDERIGVMLHDPGWTGAALHQSRNYRIAVHAAETVPSADVARVGLAVATLVGGNDRESLWYHTAYSPFQMERGPTCVPTRSWTIVTAILLALLVVVTHGLFTRGAIATPRPEPLPKMSANEWILLLGVTAIAAVTYVWPSFLRFSRYGIGSADMGIYTHAFWNAWQGHGLFNSPEGLDHLSSHASPGLYLLLPFYALAPHPLTLLALNGIALVSGVIPAYLIARRQLNASASALCAVIYLLNPALSSLSYDVHEITFAVPFFLWALCFLQTRHAGPMLLALVLAMLWKENVGVSSCFLGVYIVIVQRRFHLGMVVMLLGLLWVVVGINVIVPYFGGSHANKTMMRYAALGNDWIALLLSPIRRPHVFFATVFSPATAQYLLKVLSPFGFLPLLSPAELLLATPTLAESILDGHGELRSGLFHHEALLFPVLYVGFVGGVVRLARLTPKPVVVQRLVLILIIISQPLWRSAGRGLLDDVGGDPARAEIDAIIAQIPAEVSVISPQHIQPHVSDRRVSAYFNDDDRDLRHDYPAAEYAILPATVPPPPEYNVVYQGAAYTLCRLRRT